MNPLKNVLPRFHRDQRFSVFEFATKLFRNSDIFFENATIISNLLRDYHVFFKLSSDFWNYFGEKQKNINNHLIIEACQGFALPAQWPGKTQYFHIGNPSPPLRPRLLM